MASVEEFTFHDLFEVDTANGLYFNNVFLPEEVLTHILSFLPGKKLLNDTLVCKLWCNIIKSDQLWCIKYQREHPKKKAKHLPWYVYYSYFATNNFDTNFIKNGNGQNEYAQWVMLKNGRDVIKIERTPETNPLPSGVEEFNGCSSCFVASLHCCWKYQPFSLNKKRLLRYIMNKYMPHIYVSEWITDRFDCGCTFLLRVRGFKNHDTNEDHLEKCLRLEKAPKEKFIKEKCVVIDQQQCREWRKVEILVDEYPLNVGYLIFEHRSKDKFWAGHYGAKMAGGVLKILFDSIKPLAEGETFKTRKVLERNNDESEEDLLPQKTLEDAIASSYRRRRRMRRRSSTDDDSA